MRAYWFGVLAIGLVIVGCSAKPTTATVSRRDVEGFLVLEGTLVTPPTDYAEVLTPYRAPAEKVMVTVGKWVREGEVLVTLSYPDAQAALAQAQADVRSAEVALQNARTQFDDDVKRLESEIKNLKSRQANGEMVEDQLAVAQAELQDARTMLQSNLAPYQASMNTAQANLRSAQTGAKQASIRAPISGTVLALNAQAGRMLGEDEKPVATICDLAALEVHAPVSNEQVGMIKRSMPVSVSFDGLADEFPGTVKRIITKTDGSAIQYYAVVAFENKEGLVKPGAKVKGVAVKTGEVKNVLAVPTDAVETDNSGKRVVMILQGEDWMPTVVEVGLSGKGYTEIKSGLKEGQSVQVTP